MNKKNWMALFACLLLDWPRVILYFHRTAKRNHSLNKVPQYILGIEDSDAIERPQTFWRHSKFKAVLSLEVKKKCSLQKQEETVAREVELVLLKS